MYICVKSSLILINILMWYHCTSALKYLWTLIFFYLNRIIFRFWWRSFRVKYEFWKQKMELILIIYKNLMFACKDPQISKSYRPIDLKYFQNISMVPGKVYAVNELRTDPCIWKTLIYVSIYLELGTSVAFRETLFLSCKYSRTDLFEKII